MCIRDRDEREFEKALQTGLGGGTLIKLVLSKDGDEAGSDAFETVAILKEVQSDVVRGNAIHVDFQAVSMDEAITTKVPVVITVSYTHLDVYKRQFHYYARCT